MEIITLSSDEEPEPKTSSSHLKKNWVPPNRRYPKGFRFFLPSFDEGEKSEETTDKGTIQFCLSQNKCKNLNK